MKSQRWWLVVAIIVFLAIPVTRAWAETLDANSIGNLTNDKTRQMAWPNCLGFNCTQFWDWKQDGSICARMSGNDRHEKCADDGRWRLQGKNLCWKLEWLGGDLGYKKACVTFEETEAERYEASRVGGGVTFFNFVVRSGSK